RLLQQTIYPDGLYLREHRAPVALLLWGEARRGRDSRCSIIVQFVFDRHTSAAQLLFEVADRCLGVLDFEAYVRRGIVDKPGLLVDEHREPAAVLYKEGLPLLDCILFEHTFSGWLLVGGSIPRGMADVKGHANQHTPQHPL